MKTVAPIKNIKEWKNDEELKDFCEHIVSHSERYEKERVFEAKEILNNLKKKPIRDVTGKVIKEVLIERDGVTEKEAESLIEEAREALNNYLSEGDIAGAEEICAEYFGLESDYLFDLI